MSPGRVIPVRRTSPRAVMTKRHRRSSCFRSGGADDCETRIPRTLSAVAPCPAPPPPPPPALAPGHVLFKPCPQAGLELRPVLGDLELAQRSPQHVVAHLFAFPVHHSSPWAVSKARRNWAR